MKIWGTKKVHLFIVRKIEKNVLFNYKYNKCLKTWNSTKISMTNWSQHYPTPLPRYSIFSTFPYWATALSYPHKVDIYIFIAHSFSAASICSNYRTVVSFYYIISVKLVINSLLPIHTFFVYELVASSYISISFASMYLRNLH